MDLAGGPTGLMELAFTAVQDINRRSQDVTIHRQQCMQLAKRCAELVNKLQDERQVMEDAKLREAVDELEDVLLKVRKRIIEWVNLNHIKSFIRQNQIATELDNFNRTLDTHATKFQIVLSIELNRQRRKMDLYRQHDQEEVKEMLTALVRNVEDFHAAARMRDAVPALMQAIQVELGDGQLGTAEHKALWSGLITLYNRTGIFPPLTNLTGPVIKPSEHPSAEGGTADIYEGQWVGDQKVMFKAIRHVTSESAIKRFRRQVDIWRRLQHTHILRFYGICYIGPRLFAVTPWAENGNLLVYLEKNPGSDRMARLCEVAFGLMYLHEFKPTVVHSDLRAINVLVSATGEALLADFGLSRIIGEEESAEVASTSLASAGSFRWMAPELFESGDANGYLVSAASDVWSFGMLCLEVLTGSQPYRQCKIDGQAIAKLIGRVLPERPEQSEDMFQRGLTDNMWKLMNQCWVWDSLARPQMHMLANEVWRLHTEHLRQYGVIGGKWCSHKSGWFNSSRNCLENNNVANVYQSSFPPSQSALFQRPPAWNTSPASSTHSLSPNSLPLQLVPGVHESLDTYIPELPSSPSSPSTNLTPHNNTLAPGGIPIPGCRLDPLLLFSQASGMESNMSTMDLSPGSMPGPTLQMLAQAPSFISWGKTEPEGYCKINYDSDGRVLTGNLEGLVDRLLVNTESIRMDDEFRECFLTVYRGFAKADDLLPLLIERYKVRAYGYMPERDRERLHKNMMLILTKWLEIQEIEPKDYGFLQEMEAFVKSVPPEGPLDSERSDLQSAIIKQFQKLQQAPPFPPTNSGQRIQLSDLNASTVAKQLMRMESELFQKILPSDCAAWVKNVSDEQLLNLPRFVKNNYKIADWCQSMILFMDSNQIEQRARMIMFFRKVAEECIRIRSFSTAHAVMAGLSTGFINALDYTWRLVDNHTKDSLKQISLIVSDVDNYKSALDSDPQVPAVPILFIHLRDLRRRYRELETHVIVDGERLVNFQKFEEVWKSIQSIMKYKLPRADILSEPMATAYLTHEFSKIDDGVELQSRFKNRSEELNRKEQRDFNNSV